MSANTVKGQGMAVGGEREVEEGCASWHSANEKPAALPVWGRSLFAIITCHLAHGLYVDYVCLVHNHFPKVLQCLRIVIYQCGGWERNPLQPL